MTPVLTQPSDERSCKTKARGVNEVSDGGSDEGGAVDVQRRIAVGAGLDAR